MREKRVFNRTAIAIAVSAVFLLSACAGGGGGGGGANNPGSSPTPTPTPTPPSSSAVPFSTPTSLGTINPLIGALPGTLYAMTQNYTADLTGSGAENVVVAGGLSSGANINSSNWKNNAIQVYGWANGALVNQTSQWFSGNDNIITGSNNIQFGNFNGTGRKSMYVGPFTDGNINNIQAEIFVNNGSSFTRYNIAMPWGIGSAGSTTFMYDGVENIVALDYGPNTTFIFGSKTNNFRAVSVNNLDRAGSAIASGDFLGNGTITFAITDDSNSSTSKYSTRLYNWNLNPTTGAVTMDMIGILPMPILETTQFDSILNAYPNISGGSLRSNQIGILNYDFDGSGKPSLVVLGMPSNLDAPIHSAVQFLKNNGTGTFTDVTNSVLTGYDYTKAASNMAVIDLLNNGLPDIVVSGASGAQVLMQISKGQYVASFANVISDFQNQVTGLQSGAGSGNVINFVKGPGGQLYLLDVVDTQQSGTQKTLYLSSLGNSSSSLNANQTITTIKQLWPWMTDASANAMLATTGKTWFGATIIDDTALFSPYGGLSIATAKGMAPIQGYIAGVEFGSSDAQVTTMDSLGRSFNVNIGGMRSATYSNSFNMNGEHIDQYELTSHTEYLINGSVNTVGGLRAGSEGRNAGNTWTGKDEGPSMLNKPTQYTIGMPTYWRSRSGRWSTGAQYTTLNYNPWLAFGGAWGQVTQTGNLDHAIRYVNENGFTAVAGTTYTTTTITPGLITNVAPIAGAWGEAGYRWENNLGVYAGIKPILFSGNVTASLPTSVDNNGNTVYTKRTLALQNQTTGYLRALWSTDINKNLTYRISGTAMTNNQYRLMNEFRIFF